MAKTSKGGVRIIGGDGGAALKTLTGSDGPKSGDFVLNSQPLATKEGFKNVSKLWYDKCKPFSWGYEQLQRDKDITEDVYATIREMEPAVSDDGKFVFRYKDGREFEPTQNAIDKLAYWSNTTVTIINQLREDPIKPNGQVKFNRDSGDMEVLMHIMKNAFREGRTDLDRQYLWRLNIQDNTLRCMMSLDYSVVNNVFVLETVEKILPNSMLSHWRGDFDTMFTNVLISDSIRDTDDSPYGAMISVSNSEVGARRVSCLPSLFRAICQNGAIYSQIKGASLEQVHRGKIDLDVLRNEMKRVITEQIPIINSGIDALLATKQLAGWNGPSVLPLLTILAQDNRLQKPQAQATLEGYRTEVNEVSANRGTLFGVINAITRGAQKFDGATWDNMNQIAGRMIGYDKDDWDTLKRRAKKARTEDVEKLFGVAA